jgi:hypothetical protein
MGIFEDLDKKERNKSVAKFSSWRLSPASALPQDLEKLKS